MAHFRLVEPWDHVSDFWFVEQQDYINDFCLVEYVVITGHLDEHVWMWYEIELAMFLIVHGAYTSVIMYVHVMFSLLYITE